MARGSSWTDTYDNLGTLPGIALISPEPDIRHLIWQEMQGPSPRSRQAQPCLDFDMTDSASSAAQYSLGLVLSLSLSSHQLTVNLWSIILHRAANTGVIRITWERIEYRGTYPCHSEKILPLRERSLNTDEFVRHPWRHHGAMISSLTWLPLGVFKNERRIAMVPPRCSWLLVERKCLIHPSELNSCPFDSRD